MPTRFRRPWHFSPLSACGSLCLAVSFPSINQAEKLPWLYVLFISNFVSILNEREKMPLTPEKLLNVSYPHPVTRPTPLWRNLNFLILFSGQGISTIGTEISQVTFPLLILALTHSPARAGIMGTLGTIRVLTWLLYAFAPNPLVLGIVNTVSFIVVPVYMVVQFSCRLSLIPDTMQGRVNAVFRLISTGSQPLGIALTGFLLQAFGPVYTVLLLFAPQLLLAIVVVWQYKFLRRMQTML